MARKGPRPTLPPHLEELISLLERQDLTALDRAGAILTVQKSSGGERIDWDTAMENDTFAERWAALEKLQMLSLQDKERSAGISGTRSAGTVLRRSGSAGQNGRPVLDRSHRPLVEKHRGRW